MTKSRILDEILAQELSTNDTLWVAGYRARLLYELTGNSLSATGQPPQYQDGWQAGSVWLSSISTRECPVCGDFVIGNAAKVYCSAACRQRAYRERKGARCPTTN
jgi:hypothetical protein